MNLWGKLAKWFIGGGAKGIASEIRQAHADRLKADTDKEKLAADERMHQVAMRVEAQTRGSGAFSAKFVRACFAAPFIIYNAKLVLWDKVLGLGATDGLSPYLENVAWTVITFYFLDNTIRMARNQFR